MAINWERHLGDKSSALTSNPKGIIIGTVESMMVIFGSVKGGNGQRRVRRKSLLIIFLPRPLPVRSNQSAGLLKLSQARPNKHLLYGHAYTQQQIHIYKSSHAYLPYLSGG